MTGEEYQSQAMRTCGPDRTRERDLVAGSLGVAGEAGEIADHVKKHLFHQHPLNTQHLIKEIGDVLWYLALLCETLDIDLDEVMEQNITKLQKRYPAGFDPERSINRDDEDTGETR